MDVLVDGTPYVILTEEGDFMRAQWIAGGIQAAGIHAFVPEDNLQDEFAVAQRAMGALRFPVYVPAERVDEANTVFLNLSQPIPDAEEFHDEEDDEALEALGDAHRSQTTTIALVMLLIFLGVPGVLWLFFRNAVTSWF